MLRKVLGLCTLILLVLAVGCDTSQEAPSLPQKIKQSESTKTTPSDFLVYENSEYGVKIGYPPDWKQTETDDVIVAFLAPKTSDSDTFQKNLGLTMNDLSDQYLTLQEYNDISINGLKQTFPDIKIIESGSTALSNIPAHNVVFTSSNAKFMQVWTIKNEISYVWTYSAQENSYSDYLSTIQKMLDSFEITRNIRKTEDETPAKQQAEVKASVSDADSAFVGSWRIYSERIFYDIGGAGSSTEPVTRKLEILKDGTWKFGDSQGTWTVTEITSEDWTRWGINSYGPTRKITFGGWNKATADGPIEEEKSQIDFIWVIYHVEPPQVQNAGTVWMKFGH